MLKFKNIIEKSYNTQICSMQQIQGGWSALAYRIRLAKGDFFLKVYEKHRHTAKEWISRIDEYMPVLIALNGNDRLRGKIVAPVLTADGKYKVENDDYVFILFPFIEGNTPGSDKLTEDEQRCLSEIVAELHSYKESDFPLLKNREDFDTKICEDLSQLIFQEDLQDTYLKNALIQYQEYLYCGMDEMKGLAQTLCDERPEFVLCHTDLHGWNLLQAEQLVLLDWEGLKLAPAEADLFSFSEGFFYDYAWNAFTAGYQNVRPDYSLNKNAMAFYRVRRRLEDILEFARSILFDGLSEDEKDISMNHLRRECIALQQLLQAR